MVCTSAVNQTGLYSTHQSISSNDGDKPEECTITGTKDLWLQFVWKRHASSAVSYQIPRPLLLRANTKCFFKEALKKKKKKNPCRRTGEQPTLWRKFFLTSISYWVVCAYRRNLLPHAAHHIGRALDSFSFTPAVVETYSSIPAAPGKVILTCLCIQYVT